MIGGGASQVLPYNREVCVTMLKEGEQNRFRASFNVSTSSFSHAEEEAHKMSTF